MSPNFEVVLVQRAYHVLLHRESKVFLRKGQKQIGFPWLTEHKATTLLRQSPFRLVRGFDVVVNRILLGNLYLFVRFIFACISILDDLILSENMPDFERFVCHVNTCHLIKTSET